MHRMEIREFRVHVAVCAIFVFILSALSVHGLERRGCPRMYIHDGVAICTIFVFLCLFSVCIFWRYVAAHGHSSRCGIFFGFLCFFCLF
jgi:hypothetical protein